jgi:hypothetical protein
MMDSCYLPGCHEPTWHPSVAVCRAHAAEDWPGPPPDPQSRLHQPPKQKERRVIVTRLVYVPAPPPESAKPR